MNRRGFLSQVLIAATGRRGAAQERRPPNIVLLVASGWRGQSFNDPGEKLILPHLSRLAAEGVRFRRAYTACPSAAPARATLLTGRFPHACGVLQDGDRLPAAETTLAETLLSAGYDTGYFGHWRLDGEAEPGYVPPGERRQGFVDWAAANRVGRHYDPPYFLDGPEPLIANGFEPETQGRLAAEFVRRKRDRPHFLCLSWGLPAGRPKPPPEYRDPYNPDTIRLRFNVPADGVERRRRDLADYYALCSAVDASAGQVLNALTGSDASGDSVVVFTSDHGDMLGSHSLGDKEVAFEERVRVPLVIRYSRAIAPGRSLDMPVSIADIAPTVLNFTGAGDGRSLHGRDLSTLLANSAGEQPESVYCQGRLGSPEEWRMVVRGLDKVVVDRNLRVTGLYNLGKDPYEMWNLAEEKDARRKRDEMHAILLDWMRRTGDRILPSGLRVRE